MKVLIRGFEVYVQFYCKCRICGLELAEERGRSITVRDEYLSPREVEQYLSALRPYSLDIPVGWSSNGMDNAGQILWCNQCTGA